MPIQSGRRPLPWRTASAVAAIALTVVGCSASTTAGPPGPICTAVYVFGLTVRAVNATSGAAIDSATVTATDGAYVSAGVTSATFNGSAALAGERAGTYAINVRKSGYAPWDTTGVTVTKDSCHVHPVAVTARLTPSGG